MQLEEAQPDRNSGEIVLPLGVNFNNMFIEEDYLTDVSNYVVDSKSKVRIKEIRPIQDYDIDTNQHNLHGKMTHVLVLTTDKAINDDEIVIKLVNTLPTWVSQSSTDDDTNLHNANFSTTTFGLEYIMKGIYDSYKKMAQGSQPVYFTIKLSIN